MTKGVFTTRVIPTYDDLPEYRYHFPRTYLRKAESTVGDWIVYYEPRRRTNDANSIGGRQSYFAVAKVNYIERDPNRADHYYAFVSDYLEFDQSVPFKENDHYYEAGLQREDGNTNKGAFGRAVRTITDLEFDLILRAGYTADSDQTDPPKTYGSPGMFEEPATFEHPLVLKMAMRPFRDAAFSKQVKHAYNDTCAITGINLINGGGRSEVQAAHIRPVADDGPDSMRNGLALSGTIHWMFDRGLISINDDYSILTAEGRLPEPVLGLINSNQKLRLPPTPDLAPHPQFLQYHRATVFKGTF